MNTNKPPPMCCASGLLFVLNNLQQFYNKKERIRTKQALINKYFRVVNFVPNSQEINDIKGFSR